MSAQKWTPEVVLSREWSFAALRRMARECTDLAEGEAILATFWRKVEADPQRHERHILPMLLDCAHIVEARATARAEARA